MLNKKLLKLFIMIMLIFTLLGLVACSGVSSLKTGWVEQSGFNHSTASYSTFSGTERRQVEAAAGETIALDYEVAVEKGALTLQIIDPQDTAVWEDTFTSDDSGVIDVPVENEGRYEIAIIGEETGGSFDLSWDMQ